MEEYEMFGQDLEEESAGLGLGAMTQPQPMDLQSAVRPAANAAEAGARRGMWAEIVTKFQTNPNLQRAIGLAGAQLMQPIRPGETRAGNIGKAAVVGTNAYQMGEKADFERALKLKQEERAAAGESRTQELHPGALSAQGDTSAASRATTAATTAGTERTRKATQLTGLQIDEAIKKAEEYDDDAPLRDIKRDLAQEAAEIERGIPREARTQARLDELDANRRKITESEEKIKLAKTQREGEEKKNRAAADLQAVKDQLKVENPKEYQDMMLKRGKYSSITPSKTVSDIAAFGEMYDLLTPEERGGQSRTSYQKNMLLKEKSLDTLKLIAKMEENATMGGEPVSKDILGLKKRLLGELGAKEAAPAVDPAAAKPGAAAPGKPAAGKIDTPDGSYAKPYPVANQADRDAVPEGKTYIYKGKRYTKPKGKKPDDDNTGIAP